jgi:hypothetical protein
LLQQNGEDKLFADCMNEIRTERLSVGLLVFSKAERLCAAGKVPALDAGDFFLQSFVFLMAANGSWDGQQLFFLILAGFLTTHLPMH